MCVHIWNSKTKLYTYIFTLHVLDGCYTKLLSVPYTQQSVCRCICASVCVCFYVYTYIYISIVLTPLI